MEGAMIWAKIFFPRILGVGFNYQKSPQCAENHNRDRVQAKILYIFISTFSARSQRNSATCWSSAFFYLVTALLIPLNFDTIWYTVQSFINSFSFSKHVASDILQKESSMSTCLLKLFLNVTYILLVAIKGCSIPHTLEE